MKHRKLERVARREVKRVQKLLGLQAFRVAVYAAFRPLGNDRAWGAIDGETGYFEAEIHLSPLMRRKQVRKYVAHEMAHLLLTELHQICRDANGGEIPPNWMRHEEQVCERIMRALTKRRAK